MKPRPLSTTIVHLNYRLQGSIPAAALQKIRFVYHEGLEELLQRRSLKKDHPAHLDYVEFMALKTELHLCNYIRYDSLLDAATSGPVFLKSAEAKQIIIDSWHHIAQQYNLTIFVISVMSNHVHVVLQANNENIDLAMIMDRHKRFTANLLNKLHGRKGRVIWAKGVFDRDVRPGRFETVLWYVLNNPKKARITKDVLGWYGNWFNPLLEEEYIKPYRRRTA